MSFIDITRPVGRKTAVWPGDEPYRLEWTHRIADGAAANTGALCCTTHCGTHVDAPLHLLGRGAAAGQLPLDLFVGAARLVDVTGHTEIDERLVRELVPPGTRRVLFRTGSWRRRGDFPTRFPALTPRAALALVGSGTRLVGTDAPSVDPFDSTDLAAHRVLLAEGVPILENLLLDGVAEGVYELIALPLRLEEADASPVRALLRPRG